MAEPERYNSIIAERIREVVEKSGLSQKAIADNIGVSRQAISQYCDGSTVPNADKLSKMAQFFNVSADYLLGLSVTPSTDLDVKTMCDYTGLNEWFIDLFHHFAKMAEYDSDYWIIHDFMNRFATSECLENMVELLPGCKRAEEKYIYWQNLDYKESNNFRSHYIAGVVMLERCFSDYLRKFFPNFEKDIRWDLSVLRVHNPPIPNEGDQQNG